MTLLTGVPFMTLVLELPGRFQILNNTNAFESGVRILPFTLGIALAAGTTGALTARGRVPVFLVFCASAVLQVLGVGLLYSVAANTELGGKVYGYQVLAGTGVGLTLTAAILIAPSLVDGNGLC